MDSQAVQPTDQPASVWRLEAEFLRPYRLTLVLALVGMLVQSLLLLPVPLAQGWALDHLINAARFQREDVFVSITLALGLAILCHLIRGWLGYKLGATMTRVSLEVVRALTARMHQKLQRLPLSYFDREPTGKVMSRMTSDVGTLLIFLGSGSLQLASDLILAAGIAAVLLWLNWPLGLLAMTALPLFAANQRLLASRVRRLSEAVRARLDSVYRLLSEKVSAVRVVRAFAQEEREVAAFASRLEAHTSAGQAAVRASANQSAVAALITGAGTAAVLAGGVAFLMRGEMTAGQIAAFAALVALLYNPLVRLTQFMPVWAATRVAIDRMMTVLDEEETPTHGITVSSVRGTLRIKDLGFRYREDGPWVLDRINLHIPAGTSVGILGSSGSGKSTLLATIARLYDPVAGAVLVDDKDLRSISNAELRRSVVLVPQQALLFDGTIRTNLTYAAPHATDEQMQQVLDAVELSGLIASLPLGLETPVGERGLALSGGQRQRLALARALLTNPAVLLLDDCTSALDAETESRVWANIDRLFAGQTRVVVSHKPPSRQHVDQLFRFENGRLINLTSSEETRTFD